MSDERTKRSRPRMGLPPHWLDDVIREALKTGADASGIARAIAENPRFIEVLEVALKKHPARDAAAVQAVRCEVINALLAAR